MTVPPIPLTQVNTNGLLSFGQPYANVTSGTFPLPGPPLIAPLWADVDTREVGEVSFRETDDPALIESLTMTIREGLTRLGPFVPSHLFIATWSSVGYYDNGTNLVSKHQYQNSESLNQHILHHRCSILQTNSFQCVLASSGDKSVALFLYDSIQWVAADARPLKPPMSESGTGSGSGNDDSAPTEISFTPTEISFAVAGFSDGINSSYLLPGSGGEGVANLSSTSNIESPGVWLFRTDGESIVSGGEEIGGCSHHTLS